MARAATRTQPKHTATAGTIRPGGRTERNRQSVAAAALELLRRGHTDLSPALVAEKAGVNVSTVYRRWPTRPDLLREALTLHTRALRVPDTGSFEADVHALARSLARFFSNPAEIAMSAAMAANADPAFTAWQVEYFEENIEHVVRPFENAISRGEIAPDVDVRVLLDLLIGPMIVHTVVMRQHLAAAYVRRLADAVIRAASRS